MGSNKKKIEDYIGDFFENTNCVSCFVLITEDEDIYYCEKCPATFCDECISNTYQCPECRHTLGESILPGCMTNARETYFISEEQYPILEDFN